MADSPEWPDEVVEKAARALLPILQAVAKGDSPDALMYHAAREALGSEVVPKAEHERLERDKEAFKTAMAGERERANRAEARVESLRASLERIAHHSSDVCDGDCALWMVDIARSALADEGDSEP